MSPLSSEAAACSAISSIDCSASELPLRSIGESVPLDRSTPSSEVPDSDDSNRAEIDPASPDHLTAPPDGPSEPDALEDIFYLQREKNDRRLG
ncbi:hypothetical protein DEO72_LG1g2084 [Vigna unguiculata]|uniref:Uncharacterized protein n=1 Tax=Vigna unguiculata TaxID=3917 RepID=A0A4D6KVF2_VIGUN|nr:hypothetical protein DEO72_LG1g2084 [Vigna unguiculata]